MNKLASKVLILVMCISMVLAGCTETSQTSDEGSQNTTNEVEKETDVNKEKGMANKRPDMFGKVRSIIGNEVVLEIAEMPETPEKREKEGSQGNKTNGGEKNNGDRPQRVGGMQLKLTGETATLLIPVGIPITTRSQGGSKEIDLADIYEGVSLSIWFDDADKEDRMITRVTMMQGNE